MRYGAVSLAHRPCHGTTASPRLGGVHSKGRGVEAHPIINQVIAGCSGAYIHELASPESSIHKEEHQWQKRSKG